MSDYEEAKFTFICGCTDDEVCSIHEIERLREALQKIIRLEYGWETSESRNVARRALEGGGEDE